ncbi:MAG TPA: hypothetical protein VFR23_24565 [Jiangellaceae bacterium]|nr:hypothetical protein [Jiangellaceae bacterium]
MTPRARERLEDLATYCERQQVITWSDSARDVYRHVAGELREILTECDTLPAGPPSVIPMVAE